MLAAAPVEEARALRTFQLALLMVQGERPVPASLATYFNTVLTQAQDLTKDPKSANGTTLPEAIQLALDMRDFSVLRIAIGKISDLGTLTPAVASEILTGLERPVAADH